MGVYLIGIIEINLVIPTSTNPRFSPTKVKALPDITSEPTLDSHQQDCSSDRDQQSDPRDKYPLCLKLSDQSLVCTALFGCPVHHKIVFLEDCQDQD